MAAGPEPSPPGSGRLRVLALLALAALCVAAAVVLAARGDGPRGKDEPVGVEGGIRWLTGADLKDTIARLRAAGATHTRESIAWYRVEPRPGRFSWEQIDPWVREAARQGLRIVALLDGPPAWATGTSDRTVAPVSGPALEGYARYARAVVERYGSGGAFWRENPDVPELPIVDWNVWNEPYMRFFWSNSGEHAWPDPEGYATMFRRVVEEARGADPDARFMAEVELTTDDEANEPFLERMFEAVPDLARHMDVASVHPYVGSDGSGPRRCRGGSEARYSFCRVRQIRRLLDARGASDAELWITEFGYSTCPACEKWKVTETAQALYLRDAFRLARAWGVVDGFIWWVYRSEEDDPTRSEDWMGLVRADGSPKPAWSAFAEEAGRGL